MQENRYDHKMEIHKQQRDTKAHKAGRKERKSREAKRKCRRKIQVKEANNRREIRLRKR